MFAIDCVWIEVVSMFLFSPTNLREIKKWRREHSSVFYHEMNFAILSTLVHKKVMCSMILKGLILS